VLVKYEGKDHQSYKITFDIYQLLIEVKEYLQKITKLLEGKNKDHSISQTHRTINLHTHIKAN
jgi:hypothetical protein